MHMQAQLAVELFGSNQQSAIRDQISHSQNPHKTFFTSSPPFAKVRPHYNSPTFFLLLFFVPLLQEQTMLRSIPFTVTDWRTDWLRTLSGMSLLMQLFLRKVATGSKSIQKQVSNYILIILPINEMTVLWTKYIKSFVEKFLASLERSCSNYCSWNLVISIGFYNLDDIGEYLFTHFKVKLVW